jgi:hypothetical protein
MIAAAVNLTEKLEQWKFREISGVVVQTNCGKN